MDARGGGANVENRSPPNNIKKLIHIFKLIF
jgi:hypothetical protein